MIFAPGCVQLNKKNRYSNADESTVYPHRYSRDDSGFEMTWDPDPWWHGFDPSLLSMPLSVGL